MINLCLSVLASLFSTSSNSLSLTPRSTRSSLTNAYAICDQSRLSLTRVSVSRRSAVDLQNSTPQQMNLSKQMNTALANFFPNSLSLLLRNYLRSHATLHTGERQSGLA